MTDRISHCIPAPDKQTNKKNLVCSMIFDDYRPRARCCTSSTRPLLERGAVCKQSRARMPIFRGIPHRTITNSLFFFFSFLPPSSRLYIDKSRGKKKAVTSPPLQASLPRSRNTFFSARAGVWVCGSPARSGERAELWVFSLGWRFEIWSTCTLGEDMQSYCGLKTRTHFIN